jgi:DNA mismatch repair ATPase MutS
MLLQGSLTLFSLGQSIYQPIQNAIHLQTIHKDMVKKAASANLLLQSLKEIQTLLPSKTSLNYSLEDLESQELHQLFGTFWDSPYRLRLALNALGDYEVVYRIAKQTLWQPVEFLAGAKPYLTIQQGTDPFLESSVPFDLGLKGKTHHAILTGPNRGGKSSVLRTTLLNIVMAQSVGVASGRMCLRPFDWIATGLRLEDRPGSTSMFESEVEFSIKILQRAKDCPTQIGFVLFDELFHSTNPPDGARTADLFLQKLWLTTNTASFISTHVFGLAKKAHKKIQRLCVPAHKKEDGSLLFTYTLQKGICEVSSVDEILKEKGLLTA